jgi:large subunit ribosomal protein L35Ae
MVKQYPNQSLLRIEGVTSKEDTDFYLGKRVAYIYKAPTAKKAIGVQGIL